MANLFATLAVVANASGAATDTSAMGGVKTVAVDGAFTGTLVLEASVDGGTTWAPVGVFAGPAKVTISVAANRMRVVSSGVQQFAPFSPSVTIGANDNGGVYLALNAPAANAVSAPVDVSSMGGFTTWVVGGPLGGGVVAIEISEDGANYVECALFQGAGILSKQVIANWMRVRSRGAMPAIPFAPTVAAGAINDSGGGGGGPPTGPAGGDLIAPAGGTSDYPDPRVSRPRTAVVFRPGGAPGANVHTTWASVMAALAEISGPKTLEMDDSLAPVVVPSGIYDMSNVTMTAPQGLTVTVDCSSPGSVEFTSLRRLAGRLIFAQGVEAPPIQLFHGDTLTISATVSSTGQPLIDCSALGGGDSATIIVENAGFGNGVDRMMVSPTGGTVVMVLRQGATVLAESLAVALGSTMVVQWWSSSARVILAQSGAVGTVTSTTVRVQRWEVTAVAVAGPTTAFIGELKRCDPTAGGFVVNLPAITIFNKGQAIRIKNSSGSANALTVTPAGADTIDGAANYPLALARGSIDVVSDGVSNWEIG